MSQASLEHWILHWANLIGYLLETSLLSIQLQDICISLLGFSMFKEI